MDYLESWHPEHWDAVTLAWLHSPDGAKALSLLKAAPDLLRACAAVVWVVESFGQRGLANIAVDQLPILKAAVAKAKGEVVDYDL